MNHHLYMSLLSAYRKISHIHALFLMFHLPLNSEKTHLAKKTVLQSVFLNFPAHSISEQG